MFTKNIVELSVICTGSSFRLLNRLLKTCMTDVRSFPVCYKNIRIQEGKFQNLGVQSENLHNM